MPLAVNWLSTNHQVYYAKPLPAAREVGADTNSKVFQRASLNFSAVLGPGNEAWLLDSNSITCASESIAACSAALHLASFIS